MRQSLEHGRLSPVEYGVFAVKSDTSIVEEPLSFVLHVLDGPFCDSRSAVERLRIFGRKEAESIDRLRGALDVNGEGAVVIVSGVPFGSKNTSLKYRYPLARLSRKVSSPVLSM